MAFFDCFASPVTGSAEHGPPPLLTTNHLSKYFLDLAHSQEFGMVGTGTATIPLHCLTGTSAFTADPVCVNVTVRAILLAAPLDNPIDSSL